MTREERPVDGTGLLPEQHAAAVAKLLSLTPAQAGTLAAELRNALVPARCGLDDACRAAEHLRCREAIDRCLLLVREVAKRAAEQNAEVAKLGEVAREAAAVRAERDSAFAEERSAAADLLKIAVQGVEPALESICEKTEIVPGVSRKTLNVALIGGTSVIDRGGERLQLFVERTGRLVQVRYSYEGGAWKPTAWQEVTFEVAARTYDVERVVAALLRLCGAQAQSKGARLRTKQARARAARLTALAGLIEACCAEVSK